MMPSRALFFACVLLLGAGSCKPAEPAGDDLRAVADLSVAVDQKSADDLGTGDLWELDEVTFSPLPLMGPVARYGHVLDYDGNSRRILSFGGRLANNTLSNETWSWDGAAWTKLMPSQSPSARELAAKAWDSVRKRLVLFGGTEMTKGPEGEGEACEKVVSVGGGSLRKGAGGLFSTGSCAFL